MINVLKNEALSLFNKLHTTPHSSPLPSIKPIAYYCEALAGAGKTHNCIDLAASIAKDNGRVIIAQPGLDLINETEENFKKRYPRY